METPNDFGLPKKFTSWRNGQAEAIDAVCCSDKPIFLLDAPTGVGKSLIGVGSYLKIANTRHIIDILKDEEQPRYRCLYITRTIQLQEQILQEFPMAKTIMGRRNYPCNLFPEKFPEVTAEDCQKDKCHLTECNYVVAKRAAMSAPVAVLNDSYFLTEANGPGAFSQASLIILDEIDSLENQLMSFIEMSITERQLRKLQIKAPSKDKRPIASTWPAWAEGARYEAEAGLKRLYAALEKTDIQYWSDVEIELNRQVTRLNNFVYKLNSFIQDVNEFWLFEYEEAEAGWRATFKPVRVAEYTWKYLWRHSGRFLGMSGTIFDDQILADDIGITDWDYSRMDSPFPEESRLIYYAPVADLRFSTMQTELPKLTEAVEKLLSRYTNDRVLVHTVSYLVRDYLMAKLSCQDRLMTHDPEDRAEALAQFLASPKPSVMLSPSFDRGVDLSDESCRCVIICKVPYLKMGDPQIKARMNLPNGQRWYNLKAAQSIVQMSGRAVRSELDHADTWILDRQFQGLLARTRHIIPRWWQEAIREGRI